MAAPCRIPVVVVLGCTGTGKSKLALELGRIFNGEIISADSMQIYKGLDIITNKVTMEERQICPHHLLDYLSPLHYHNTVVDFRNRALPIIDCLLKEKKVPIIVGGTNYYIESLLWKFLINQEDVDTAKVLADKSKVPHSLHGNQSHLSPLDKGIHPHQIPHVNSQETPESREQKDPVQNHQVEHAEKPSVERGCGFDCNEDEKKVETSPTDIKKTFKSDYSTASIEEEVLEQGQDKLENVDTKELHRQLLEVDPVSAQRIHPRNRRKIARALEVYEKYGVPISQIHKMQHLQTGGDNSISGPLRYEHTCIFWLQCEQSVLDERLDKRVDAMLQQGLIKELTDFHALYNASRIQENKKVDYTLGIFQSIGFKEFHKYLLLTKEERNTNEGQKHFEEGVADLKVVTRRYARRQITWVKNRFLKRPGGRVPAVYNLDVTDVDKFDELVLKPAQETLQAILEERTPELKPIPPEKTAKNCPVHNMCEVCDGRIFTMESEWEAHLQGRRHKKMVEKKKRQAQNESQAKWIKLVETTDILDTFITSQQES
ncbi:hypothetical protein CHS0354_024617 [Potamilus streckersoni]|uniref:C2H2-type domain-containing protein n=1 Tax=Potamilus streckersoni TaxID=2493646 RepID=A0AAE0S3A7_9BIVA|nr:hypothetical protein CHS0354_024617 [Potamilus streckersoni]